MKSRELLSIVLSLIMVLGVTAGSAYAQTNEVDTSDSVKVTDDSTVVDAQDEVDTDDSTKVEHDDRDYDRDNYRDGKQDLDDKLDRYCEMTDEEKRELISKYDKAEEHVVMINEYCELDEDAREAYIEEHKAEFKMKHDKDIRDKLARYCEMSDEDKQAFLAEHDKAEDHATKMNEYCELDEDAREAFIKEHKDEYKSQMKDRMTDMKMDKVKGKHMDYDRICALSESDRALEFDDLEKLERISNWCNMSTEEREEYKKETHGMKGNDMKMDKVHDKVKMSDMSPRLKAMIMDKRDISDERTDEIRMKYEEKHGDIDAKNSELKMKFKNHMATMRVDMSLEHRSAIQDRVAEMKAFKIDLRERSADLTDEEKQVLREEFVEKAKDIRLAWVSPRHQMNAGIDSAEIECREGFSLVLKESNGKAMCLKADTALKMIDRGIAVPAI